MDIDRIIKLSTTVKVQMDVLQRRVGGKPGHQNITPAELLTNVRSALDLIEVELTSGA